MELKLPELGEGIVDATVVNVPVKPGQPVKAGQMVARMDPTDVQARVNARLADVEVTKAQLQLAEKNRDTQHTRVEKGLSPKTAFYPTQSGYGVARDRLRGRGARGTLNATPIGASGTTFADTTERFQVSCSTRLAACANSHEEQLEIEPEISKLFFLFAVGEHVADDFADARFLGGAAEHEVEEPSVAAEALQLVAHLQMFVECGADCAHVVEQARRGDDVRGERCGGGGSGEAADDEVVDKDCDGEGSEGGGGMATEERSLARKG